MTTIVFVLTSIQSLLSKVIGSLAIIMTSSRLSAFVILYKPRSGVSSNEVPEEKNKEEASDVRLEMYLKLLQLTVARCSKLTNRVATMVEPSETTKFIKLGLVCSVSTNIPRRITLLTTPASFSSLLMKCMVCSIASLSST
jgi:hypothetical protein